MCLYEEKATRGASFDQGAFPFSDMGRAPMARATMRPLVGLQKRRCVYFLRIHICRFLERGFAPNLRGVMTGPSDLSMREDFSRG
jgi:hypothetical protein